MPNELTEMTGDTEENVEDPVENLTDAEKRRSKRKIYKNIIFISLAFTMLFTSYGGLERLQSSLHREEGMGAICQSILYTALLLSSLFLPTLLIAAMGHKWTIATSIAGYTLWMVANGYAVWGTMVPTSILLGLAAAPLWTAKSAYVTKMAVKYAALNEEEDEVVIARFFRIFFMFFQAAMIIGSIVSATALRPREKGGSNVTLTAEEIAQQCGVNFCPGNDIYNPNLENPSQTTVWIMVGIYLAIAVGAILLVVTLVENLPKEMRDPKLSGTKLLRKAAITVKLLKVKEMVFLIPLTTYVGLGMTFFSADYQATFVSCIIGIHGVGLVFLAYAVTGAITSISAGFIVKYTGRIPAFVAGLVVDLSVQITLQVWVYQPGEEYVLFIVSALWGASFALWKTQTNALYGSVFTADSEAAFSNYRMWESVGCIIGYGYSSFLCTRVKLGILTAALIVGMIGYAATEISIRIKTKKENKLEKIYSVGETKVAELHNCNPGSDEKINLKHDVDI